MKTERGKGRLEKGCDHHLGLTCTRIYMYNIIIIWTHVCTIHLHKHEYCTLVST